MTIRSVRNNNPGNIDRGDFNWLGTMPPEQMTPAQKMEPRFVVFETPGWGFRALCVELHTYWTHDGCKTIEQLISRWAPPAENNTAAYIVDVARKAGIGETAPVNLDDKDQMTRIARAIASHETGGSLLLEQSFYPYWKDEDLLWGVERAAVGSTD